MILKKILLQHFKNYSSAEIEFSGQIICITGQNGQGKTNLLDAIHYLSLTKSFLNHQDTFHIQKGENFFHIAGDFQNNDGSIHHVVCHFDANSGKKIIVNSKTCERFADHIGQFPVIIIAPQDFALLDAPEHRRKFFDATISQFDKVYLTQLIQYNKVLQQRNAFLKKTSSLSDTNLLETYDIQLAQSGEYIYRKRYEFLQEFTQVLRKHYVFTQNDTELPDIEYISQFDGTDFLKMLSLYHQRDMQSGFTNTGIHRDDFDFRINGMTLKKYASQGQQKSFLIALKIAQFTLLRQKLANTPLLLFDDIHDRLDQRRLQRLIQLFVTQVHTQIFLTDTSDQRIREVLKDVSYLAEFFQIAQGQIIHQNNI